MEKSKGEDATGAPVPNSASNGRMWTATVGTHGGTHVGTCVGTCVKCNTCTTCAGDFALARLHVRLANQFDVQRHRLAPAYVQLARSRPTRLPHFIHLRLIFCTPSSPSVARYPHSTAPLHRSCCELIYVTLSHVKFPLHILLPPATSSCEMPPESLAPSAFIALYVPRSSSFASVSHGHSLFSPNLSKPLRLRSPSIRRVNIAVTATSADTSPPHKFSHDTSRKVANSARKKISIVGVIFLIITYFWSVLLFIPMAIAHPLVICFDKSTRRFHDFIAMAWMKLSFFTFRVKPKLINSHLLPSTDTPAVFVANHTSYLDIYSFAYLQRRIKYVSKAEIFQIPIVGWAMAMAGNVPLRRMNKRGQMEAFRKMVSVIRNGLSLVIFPEGTRSLTGKLHRFQSGAFRAAKSQNAPVIPVTILGTRESMPSYAWVPLRYPPKPISLIIHSAIDSSKYSVEELRDRAFTAIDSALPVDVQTRPHPKHQISQ